MTISYQDLVEQFGANGLAHLPGDRFARILRFNPELLSPDGAVPIDVPIVFTAVVDGPAKLFDLIEIEFGGQGTLRLIVVGAAPHDQDLLFCLDASSGSIALVGLKRPSVEPVNASMRAFVEFLLHMARLIDADQGAGPERTRSARALRERLAELDPTAFADPENWWAMAFDQLVGAG